jgi:hypothetical protein
MTCRGSRSALLPVARGDVVDDHVAGDVVAHSAQLIRAAVQRELEAELRGVEESSPRAVDLNNAA